MDNSNNEIINQPQASELSLHKQFLTKILNKSVKIEITDGRVLIGTFVCTDMHSNVILGSCQEFIDKSSMCKHFR
jgi:small nuclear ribonucleoprotein (snRNP)-like protein